MDKYMKMSDYFVGDMIPEDIVILDGGVATVIYTSEEAAAHAINSHDELVAMKKELLAALELMVNISLLDVVNSTKSDMALSAACNAIAKAKAAS